MDNQNLIGVSDAAEIACVSRQTIQTWISSGWLTVVKRGRPEGYKGQPKALVDRAEVERLARERGTIDGPTGVQSM
jgi:hypothetical protein